MQMKVRLQLISSTPTLAKRINEAGKSKNVYTLDAPVSGGDVGAKSKTRNYGRWRERNI